MAASLACLRVAGLSSRGTRRRYTERTMPDLAHLEVVMRYHERTKHHFHRFAPGPGALDWANQPDPFRRYAGAPLARLPLLAPDDEPVSPAYDSLYVRGAAPVAPLSIRSPSRLLEYSLALSAWNYAGTTPF